ncbi:hypothetical protein PIB30_039215 [Stylosanthes scabra]|uniref:Uncharacterized protein n=1 Tax=Stylosanthes scabra TaxID=79078 RepID=A0ABU6REB1_9FABA|nr:hypothetical protein [Stylosanthes scabra]
MASAGQKGGGFENAKWSKGIADLQQPPSPKELFALVTNLRIEIQQLHDSQNGNGRPHGNGHGGGGGSNGGNDIPYSDDDLDSDDTGSHSGDNNNRSNTLHTTRT